MEEYLDILDEEGDSTGQTAPRSVAHSQGFWHRTVHIYFYRKKENNVELLVHLRSKTEDLNPGKWDTRFGGHLKAGETLEQAVVNEVKEEVGLKLLASQLALGPIFKRNNGANCEFTHAYFYNYKGNLTDLHFNDGEVQEIKWMDINAILTSIQTNSEEWAPGLEKFKKIRAILLAL